MFDKGAEHGALPAKVDRMQRTLLIADCDPQRRRDMRREAARCGYLAVEACDGAEAIEFARDWKPDAIFAELDLPLVDGIAVSRAVLGDAPCVIVRVGRSIGGNTLRAAIEAGVADLVERDCPTAEIIERFRRLLEPSSPGASGSGEWSAMAVDELATLPLLP